MACKPTTQKASFAEERSNNVIQHKNAAFEINVHKHNQLKKTRKKSPLSVKNIAPTNFHSSRSHSKLTD